MKTTIRTKNGEFLVIFLKHVLGLMGHAHPRGTTKMWTIDDENDHKTKNYEFLVMSSNLYRVLWSL
jgi:hypothetical protein